MKKNRVGLSDLYVSELTLGCMSLGKDMYHAKNMIDYAAVHGINHLDTANLYDYGVNEQIVGEAIKGKRADFIITSKVGNNFNTKTKSHFWDPSPAHIEEAITASLKRLQTDYIDLYLLHGGRIEDDKDSAIESLEKLKQKGLIRAYGLSSIRPNVIDYYAKHASIDAVMMQYSMLDRRPEALFSLLEENDVSVLARGPLAKGILSKNGEKYIDKKASDGYLTYTNAELKNLISILQKINLPLNTLALQYILREESIASAVFGASSLKQMEDNLAYTAAPRLTSELYEKIQTITKESLYTEHLI